MKISKIKHMHCWSNGSDFLISLIKKDKPAGVLSNIPRQASFFYAIASAPLPRSRSIDLLRSKWMLMSNAKRATPMRSEMKAG